MATADVFHPCRFCGEPLHHVFLDLGKTPLANSYLKKKNLDQVEPKYSLRVHICESCLLVQAQPVVTAEHIFSDYAYFSSYSSTWLEHAENYSSMIIDKLGLGPESLVVEIASNDGYLLKNFVVMGIPCLGVEPAANVAEVAIGNQVPTEIRFFGEKTAKTLLDKYQSANLIIANNVLAHVPDLNDFMRGFKTMLEADGTITVEFPHILQLIQNVEFDTIYHEHYSYFSLFTLEKIFRHHGLAIYDAEELPTHGGSLRIYACHQDNARSHSTSSRMKNIRVKEENADMQRLQGYMGMQEKVKAIKASFLDFLQQAKSTGKKVAAYGAAAKGNTFLNVCGATSEAIDFVADKNTHKQGCYLPGSHIPILPPNAMIEKKSDFVLILPWNLEKEIRDEWQIIKSWGGKFVTAIPALKIWE